MVIGCTRCFKRGGLSESYRDCEKRRWAPEPRIVVIDAIALEGPVGMKSKRAIIPAEIL